MDNLLQSCPHLRKLYLGDFPSDLIKSLPASLQSFRASWSCDSSKHTPLDDFRALGRQCPKLYSIFFESEPEVMGRTNISAAEAVAIIQGCGASLAKITVYIPTDQTLFDTIIESCPRLNQLILLLFGM